MQAGALRETLIAELERMKRDLGADGRAKRREELDEAIEKRHEFAYDRGDHNIAFGERTYLGLCAQAWTVMQTAIDAWHAAPGPDPVSSARSLALRLRRAARIGPLSFAEDPKAAWVRIDVPADETEPPGDCIRRLASLCRRWAESRGFTVLALADGDPLGGALLRIDGVGVFGALKTESGEHRFLSIGSGADASPATVRVEVEVFADGRDKTMLLSNNMNRAIVARHGSLLNCRQEWEGGASLWAHLGEGEARWSWICGMLNAGREERMFEQMVRGLTRNFHDPLPMPDVRHYTMSPSPLVRDVWSGVETRELDLVLAGGIDRFLDGPEGGDPF